MPELVHSEVGFVCNTEKDFLEAIRNIASISPKKCREWVISHFGYQKMAQEYVKSYEKILSNEFLNVSEPYASEAPEQILPILS